jgi:DNA ligase-1
LADIDTPLDGELIIPGEHFQVMSGKIRSNSKVDNVVYYVFDIVDRTLPFEKRLEVVRKLRNKSKNIKVVKHMLVHNRKEVHEFYDKCISAGLEGVVIKNTGHFYRFIRSVDWMKMKEINTIEGQIVDYQRGTGKFSETLGALIVKLENGVIANVGSGFSDMDRNYFWSNKEENLGKFIEIEYHERTLDGSLRHARFIRIRDDKTKF